MKFATVCSGIEACSSAWEPLGWKAQFFSEIEPFPCEVLKYHYPTVPNYGDMTQYKEWKDGSVDVLCGGTPCQSFSFAGLRKGIESPNGQLMLTFGAILKKYQPRWMVWENVPGVLSSNRGKDFGTFLGMLGECGYGFAYRVLNAEYFGVAQRRRRVFVVGYLGDWKRPASVLFEPESLQRNLAESRKKGQGTTRDTENSIGNCSELPKVTPCLNGEELKRHVSNQMIGNAESWFIPEYLGNAEGGDLGGGSETIAIQGDGGTSMSANGMGWKKEQSFTLNTTDKHSVAFSSTMSQPDATVEKTPSMKSYGPPAIANNMQVRRLTPTECERLQGFEDGHTKIPYRNKSADECPDGPRYKALGNSMAVPVMKCIGERIIRTEKIFYDME